MQLKNKLRIKIEENAPDFVGKPFNNPFEIFIFNAKEKNIIIQTYEKNIIEKLELNNFSNLSSAYCNGNNFLFISGGESKDSKIINKLWKVDLIRKDISDPIIISPKKNHSMICIPNNYVFIIGGNDKKTFYFDNENYNICKWAYLNKERIEPALIRISNYLYCFDSISNDINEDFSIEKTDLNKTIPEWVLLKPKMDFSLNQKFLQKCFGLAKNLDNNIIFLGGDMNNVNEKNNLFNCVYNINKNTIEESKTPFIKYNLKEKTFIKYSKNVDYILPNFDRKMPEVIFYIKKKSKTEKIIFKLNQKMLSPQLNIDFVRPKDDLEKTTFNFPESIILEDSQIKQNYKNNNDIDKNILINNSYNINNDNNKNSSNKIVKNKRPNSYRNPYFGRTIDYENEIIIPKFHYNINDPGNEFVISRKNKMYSNYIPIEQTRVKYSQLESNKNENIYPKNYNFFNNINSNKENKIISIGKKSLPKNQYNNSRDIRIKGKTPTKGEFNYEGIIKGLSDTKYKKENNYSNKSKKEEYKLTGTIIGINDKPKVDLNSPNIDLKKSSCNLNVEEIEENKPEIEIANPIIKIGNIQKFKINSPKNDKKINSKIEDINTNEIKLNSPIIDISSSDINNLKDKKFGFNYNPNIESPQNQINFKNSKFHNSNIDNEYNKIYHIIETPKIEIKENNLDINFKTPKININLDQQINEGNKNNIEISLKKNINNLKELNKDKDNKNDNLSGFIPGFNSKIKNHKRNKIVEINEDMLIENKIKANKLRKSSIEVKGSRKISSNFSLNNQNPYYYDIYDGGIYFNSNIESNNFNMIGFIKGKKTNIQINNNKSVNIEEKNINLNSIDDTNFKSPKKKINFQDTKEINQNLISPTSTMSHIGSSLKSPKNDIDCSIYGSVGGAKVNSPEFDYKLIGEIPGKKKEQFKSRIKNNIPFFYLEGIIPSNKFKKAKTELKNDIKINPSDGKINIKEDKKIENSYTNIKNLNIDEYLKGSKFMDKHALIDSEMKLNFSNVDKNEDTEDKKSEKNNLDKINNIISKVNSSQENFNLKFNQYKLEEENNNNYFNLINNENKACLRNPEICQSKIENDIICNNNLRSMIMSENKNSFNIFSTRGGSKKKNKRLPLVGSKNNNFELSKKEKVGNFDINRIRLNNPRSTNVGINGVKIGSRIIE